MENINKRIELLCKELNISITELSKRIGMPQTTVNSYINGSRKMSVEFTSKLINTFGLNANWLLTGTGEMLRSVIEVDGRPIDINLSKDVIAMLENKIEVLNKEIAKLKDELLESQRQIIELMKQK